LASGLAAGFGAGCCAAAVLAARAFAAPADGAGAGLCAASLALVLAAVPEVGLPPAPCSAFAAAGGPAVTVLPGCFGVNPAGGVFATLAALVLTAPSFFAPDAAGQYG